MDAAKSGTRPYRLGAFVDGVGWVEHEYGRVWERQPDRLAVAPDVGHVSLILALTDQLAEPFDIRYELLVPRDECEEEGAFVLREPLNRTDLHEFMRRYRALFEEDGRHHLYVSSREGEIIYDQHNVLYMAGPLDRFEAVLRDAGLREGRLQFPSPHSHHYHQELDAMLDEMLEAYDWRPGALST
ncbi:MAG TPA: hypothetical protein VMI31_15535 [Fimbriimonadaceae bacterium]|nr:hypothetical protein [Fimbriimonadaceae bacterium]